MNKTSKLILACTGGALALLLIGVMVLAWTQRNKIAKKS